MLLLKEMRSKQHLVFVGWMYHSWLVLLAIRILSMKRRPVILYCRHSDIFSLKWSTKAVARLSFFLSRRVGARIVFNSLESLENHRPFCRGLDCRVIPNGFEIGQHPTSRKRFKVLGFFGRNHPDKGADLLPSIIIKLLQELNDWCFHVAGPGMSARSDEIFRSARICGIDEHRIRIDDVISDSSTFYDGIDVLVVPSRTESFPNVIVEALISGVLVAATDVGENRNILNGHLRCASNIDELIRLAVELCDCDEEAFDKMSEDVRRHVASRYSWNAVYPMHKQLWAG